ncbi:hypothetical protein L9F63_022024, partial [Diploptera punctata]
VSFLTRASENVFRRSQFCAFQTLPAKLINTSSMQLPQKKYEVNKRDRNADMDSKSTRSILIT